MISPSCQCQPSKSLSSVVLGLFNIWLLFNTSLILSEFINYQNIDNCIPYGDLAQIAAPLCCFVHLATTFWVPWGPQAVVGALQLFIRTTSVLSDLLLDFSINFNIYVDDYSNSLAIQFLNTTKLFNLFLSTVELENARLPTLQECRMVSTLICGQRYQHSASVSTFNWQASELVLILNVCFCFVFFTLVKYLNVHINNYASLIYLLPCEFLKGRSLDLSHSFYTCYLLTTCCTVPTVSIIIDRAKKHAARIFTILHDCLACITDWLDVSNCHLNSDKTEVLVTDPDCFA